MIHRLRHFFLSQKLFSALSAFFVAYLIVFFFGHFTNNSVLAFLQIIGGLFFMVFGTGIGVTLIIQALFKRNFDQWEFISLALLGGMVITPSILTAEFILLHKIYDWYPIANSLALWCAAGVLLFHNKTFLPAWPSFSKTIFKHPLFIVLIFGFIFTLIQVFLYQALPDLDPYKWLMKYTYQFANQQLDYSERPFFGAMVFIGTRFTSISILAFFKYVVPFLFLSVLFPAWMVARNFTEKSKQWIFLLFVFTSPLIILYAETPMPQFMLIVLSYFFVFFLLYSFEKNNDFWLYSAGASIFLSFFYHQAGIIIFIIWAIAIIIAKRALIFSDKKTFFLIAFIIASNISFFEKMRQFLSSWISIVIAHIFLPNSLNLLYPAYYTNVDRNAMGWGSLSGVLKFYAFNMGPLVGGLLALFLIIIIFNPAFRSFFRKIVFKNYAILIAIVTFVLFFTIAEILPRYPNISLLPDRAWIFSGVFSFVFIFIILRFIKTISRRSMFVFISFLIISISGALYVNYLKYYLITPAQWNSADWIETHLPENRIFLSYGHKTLLPFYADTTLIKIPSQIYCDNDIQNFQNTLKGNTTQSSLMKIYYDPFLKSIKTATDNASKFYFDTMKTDNEKYANAVSTNDTMINQITGIQKTLREKTKTTTIFPLSRIPVLFSPIPIEDVYEQTVFNSEVSPENKSFFVYYSRQSDKNPYRDRPYEILNWGIDPCPDGKFLFDLYPDKFKRIYSTNDDEVIIWQLL